MTKIHNVENFEQVIEKIVFDEEELEELKIAIRNFTEGTVTPKLLKQKLLQSRGRMVKDISNFLSFWVDRIRSDDQTTEVPKIAIKNQSNQANIQLQQDLIERNELLAVVAKRINHMVEKKKEINF